MQATNRGGSLRFYVIYVAILLVWVTIFSSLEAGTCPGVCQPSSYYCPTSYKSGLCPGSSDIKCCEQSTNCGTGQCQINTLSCPGGYKSGLCPGGNDIQCCQVNTTVNGVLGLDVATSVSASNFNCLVSKGYNYTIVRAYRSNGQVDTNAPTTIKNAWNAGMGRVDIYMFPCYSCGNPAGQVSDTVNYLKQNNVKYTTYWFDIEDISYWSSSKSSNQQFFQSMISQAKSLNQNIGVYTSSSQWDQIMGNSYTGGSAYPLWYPHYQSPPQPNFNDFSPFAGWKSPAIKQYAGDETDCSTNVDLNYAKSLDYTY